MKNLLFGTLAVLFANSCSSQNSGKTEFIKSYYFPYACFNNPRTYYYVNANDTSEKSTWIMQIKIEHGDTLFLTQILDSKNRIGESLVERIDNASSVLIGYKLFNYDEEGHQSFRECKIEDSVVFKWNQKMNEAIVWKVNFLDFYSNNSDDFSKTRTLIRIDTSKETAEFKDQFHFKDVTHKTYNWYMESHYKKGKGLINYKVYYPDGFMKDFRLMN